MKALFWILQVVALALLAVSITTGGISTYESLGDEEKAQFFSKFQEDPIETTFNSIVFLLSYQFVTPAHIEERFGDDTKKTWILEDFPFPDSRDVIPIYFIGQVLIALSIGISKLDLTTMQKILFIFALFTIGIIIGWFLFKIAMYYVMYNSGAELGFSAEKILEIRQADSQRQIDIYGVRDILLLTAMFGIVLLMGLIKGGKDD